MTGNAKTPRVVAGASSKDLAAGGGRAATVAQGEALAQQGRRERARWHVTLGVIRAHLDEQPSRAARRAAARRWCAAITQMAGEEPR